jgi:hypothetical protein
VFLGVERGQGLVEFLLASRVNAEPRPAILVHAFLDALLRGLCDGEEVAHIGVCLVAVIEGVTRYRVVVEQDVPSVST